MITSNVFLFWLYFIWKNYSLLERNEEEILFCECKWESLDIRSAKKLLMELRTKAAAVMWKNEFDLADLGSGISLK